MSINSLEETFADLLKYEEPKAVQKPENNKWLNNLKLDQRKQTDELEKQNIKKKAKAKKDYDKWTTKRLRTFKHFSLL